MPFRTIGALSALLALTAAADARPARHRAPAPSPEMAQALARLDDRVSDCFAEAVMSIAKARSAARSGNWYEAAGISGYVCRAEAGVMMRAHDGIAGKGAGYRYFKGTYARRLDTALSSRVKPQLARADYAEALPPADPVLPVEAR